MLQRSVITLTQDLESARTVLQSGVEDAKRRISTSSRISGVVTGLEDLFAE